YAMGIMHLRFFPQERRNLSEARTWIEKALAFTAMRPPSSDRTINLAFLRNTMALVETQHGRSAQAIAMLGDALAFLEREAPDKFDTESPIFYRNRARLHARLGQTSAAVSDLTTMLRHEPSNAAARLEIARLYRDLDRPQDALEQVGAAIAW